MKLSERFFEATERGNEQMFAVENAEAILTALRAAESSADTVRPDEWQPIETAPKQKILMFFAVTEWNDDGSVANWKMATGSYNDGWATEQLLWTWDGRVLEDGNILPTHWQPIPTPPVTIRARNGDAS